MTPTGADVNQLLRKLLLQLENNLLLETGRRGVHCSVPALRCKRDRIIRIRSIAWRNTACIERRGSKCGLSCRAASRENRHTCGRWSEVQRHALAGINCSKA